ncbi:MAG: hypothetical protein GKS06_19680 [Acidobacteria bacterium]|nr:hypothetical protein [Acidobacteriota bacterium]
MKNVALRLAGTVVTLGLVLTYAAAARPADEPTPTAVDRTAALDELERWLDNEQSFSGATRSEAERLLREYRDTAHAMSEPAFYMAVRRLVALAENGHSNVSTGTIYSRFGLVPLRTYWFSDGLFIVRAHRLHRDLIGLQIRAINGHDIETVERRLMDFHGGSREMFRRYAALPLFLSPAVLHAAGLGEREDVLTLTLSTPYGGARNVEVKLDAALGGTRTGTPFRLLLSDQLPGEDDWLVATPGSGRTPLRLRDPQQRFRHVDLDDVAYIQFRANIAPRRGLEDFAERTQERLERSRPSAIIFDNRDNGGGDLTRAAAFALALPDLVAPGGKVYVLTDHATFSAGIYSSFFPESAAPDRTLIVGALVGDFTRFWAESNQRFQLPGTDISIGSALQLHDIGVGCPDSSVCHMTRYPAAWNIAIGSLEPEIPIGTTFADFSAGRDPVLAWALEDAASR